MNERYSIKFTISNLLNINDSSVVIEGGALFHDNKTGQKIVLLKLRNARSFDFKLNKVKVRVFYKTPVSDITKSYFDFEYNNIFVAREELFGAKTSIVLPNDQASEIQAVVLSAEYEDGWHWDNTDGIKWFLYNHAKKLIDVANTQAEFNDIANRFTALGEYLDSSVLSQQCNDKADVCKKNDIYLCAISDARKDASDSVSKAIRLFSSISGWKDADDQRDQCEARLPGLIEKERNERIKHQHEEEQQRKRQQKKKKLIVVCASVLAVIIVLAIAISVISYVTKKAILQYSFDNGTFSAEFVKENFGTLHNKKFSYSVIKKQLEQCKENNDVEGALQVIYVLGESDFVFGSKSDSDEKVYFSRSYLGWINEHAATEGVKIKDVKKDSDSYSYETYELYGYKIWFERVESKGWLSEMAIYIEDYGWMGCRAISQNQISDSKTILIDE